MNGHPVFAGLPLHPDEELSALLGSAVVSRAEVHAWPLSVVQRVVLAYESQLPPTVEPAFYAAASLLGPLGAAQTMLLDWIDAPQLGAVASGRDALVRHGRAVVHALAALPPDLPVRLDIGSPPAWASVVEKVLGEWRRVIDAGWFLRTTPRSVAAVRRWASSRAVVAAVAAGGRVVHADLRADQIFVTADGYRVIDWQRPARAPSDVDLVSLLVRQGIDPAPYVCAEAIGMHWFLALHWAVEAQHDLFPGRRVPLFDDWAREAADGIRTAAG
jgi:hypothetical protein